MADSARITAVYGAGAVINNQVVQGAKAQVVVSQMTRIVAVSSVAGSPGQVGPQGDEIELRKTATHIQWRIVGDPTWIDLVSLADITGPAGSGAVNSVNGEIGAVVLNTDDVLDIGATSKYVTAADLVKLAALSGTNTGDQNLTPYFHKTNDTSDAITQGTTKLLMTAAERTKLTNTSGTNTGDQTTITGNAGSATVLQTARTINGVSFNGSANITIADATKEPIITIGTSAQYYRGDKTMQTLNQDAVPSGTTNKAYTATEQTKLAGIATGATANSSDATLLARANHTGTQSADTITDGTTNKAFLATERTKLTGIATGATANSSDATLLARANHTGTQSADTITDGTTNKAYTATEKTKLAGIATGATANDTDANLKARANHTGTQLASTISDFSTAADARITAANKKTDSMTSMRLLGRGTASTGPIEEITLGTNLSLSGTTLNAAGGGGGGGGDVSSTVAVSVDNVVARMDGTTGKLIQDSAVGIDDSGNITTPGTVDGRDLSVDGTKLDGIASGATANTGDMVLASAQTNTGAKTYLTGTLLMRDPANTFSAEPYSDANPPFTLNLSDQTTTPATPVAGQSTLHTPDGIILRLIDNTGTVYTFADLTSTQTLAGKTLTTPTIASFVNAGHNHTNAAGGGQLTDAALSSAVTVAKGGSGRTTATTAYGLIAAGTTATGVQQTIAPGTSGQFLKSAGASALAAFSAIAESDVTNLVTDLAAKAPLASPAFTGTPTGITATHVGLGNVSNTSDATKNTAVATLQNKTFDDTSPTAFMFPGFIMPYPGRTAPNAAWLLANGQAVSRSTYAALFAVLMPNLGTVTVSVASPAVVTKTAHGLKNGDAFSFTTTGALPTGLTAGTTYYVTRINANTFNLSTTPTGVGVIYINTSGTQSGTHTGYSSPYGAGDGSTTFNVPDMRGRVIAGVEDMGGVGSAGRLVGAAFAPPTPLAIGGTGGAETHTLTVAQLAPHTHVYRWGSSGASAGGGNMYAAGFDSGRDTDSAGSGVAHNNMQPTILMNYIIKT